jgi:hypothetical protein
MLLLSGSCLCAWRESRLVVWHTAQAAGWLHGHIPELSHATFCIGDGPLCCLLSSNTG